MIDLDPLSTDPLAKRLEKLSIAVPRPVASPAPRLATAGPRRLFRWPKGLAAVGVACVLALAITADAYPGGLAGLTQDALRAAGLTSQQVLAIHGSGGNQNLKVAVNGGYADQVSTIIFASIDMTCVGADPGCGIGGPYLTDQYGSRYEITGGEGIGVGAYPMFFEPLRGPAVSNAQLALHVPQGSSEVVVHISGGLRVVTARVITPPAAVVDGRNGVTYEIRGLTFSGTYFEVHTILSGNLDKVIIHVGPSGNLLSGEIWPGVFVLNNSGKWLIPLAQLRPHVDTSVQDETRIFSIPSPGSYQIVVANSADQNTTLGGPKWQILARWTIDVR